jgi:hypothetical protein
VELYVRIEVSLVMPTWLDLTATGDNPCMRSAEGFNIDEVSAGNARLLQYRCKLQIFAPHQNLSLPHAY